MRESLKLSLKLFNIVFSEKNVLTFNLNLCSRSSFLKFSIKNRLIGGTSPASIITRSSDEPIMKQFVPLKAAASLLNLEFYKLLGFSPGT
jgi:hypothetical protein